MSDENTQVDPVVDDAPKVDVVEDQPRSFDEAYVKKLRDEAANYRVKLKEYEDAQKTESEKQAERIAELERENASFKQRDQVAAWAAEITQGSHIPASALRGDTEEALRAHFDELKSLIPEPNGAPKQVVPIDLSGGKPGSSPVDAFAAALEGIL